jgi:hypothetical protein
MNTLPPAESLPVAVRAFASPLTTNSKKGRKAGIHGPPSIGFSDWTLIFDTETTTDASQQLRFGVYQVRKWGRLRKAGFFYDPPSLTESELATLQSYADDHALEALTVQEFVEKVFFPYAYARGDLSDVLKGRRKPSKLMLAKVWAFLLEES